jgi:Zn-dependent protease
MALYINKNGEQLGPYSLEEAQRLLRSGTLTETDWAWCDGLPDWVALRQIPGFAASPQASPPPPVPTATPVAYDAYKAAPPPAEKKSLLQKIGTGIAAVGYAAFKYKAFAFTGLKTALSMLLMIGLYSWFFGWPFAVGLVFMIFVHEMGHVIAAKWLGIPVSAMTFIPFFGAFTSMKESPRDAWTEALMACGGPIAGCIGSWICLYVGFYLDSLWLIAIASVSFLINLFNLVPVPPFDGGSICAAISRWFWLVGLALLGAALFYFHSWYTVIMLTVIIVLFTIPRIMVTFAEESSPEMQDYYRTHISNRLIMALLYLGIFAALIVGYGEASMRLAYIWETSSFN